VETGNDLARQLHEAQGQLAQARQKYAPDHPDVLQLERLVDSIERTMSEAPLTAAPLRQAADNPAYIQVSAQREAAVNERASLQRKHGALQAKIHDFESRMAQSPGIEREYSALVRDVENAQLKYREVRQKKEEATLAKNLEVERKSERFTLIEPPLIAEEPISPNRPIVLALGVLLALGAGVGLAFALEALDPTVRNRRDMDVLLPVAPLALLPWIETPSEVAARARMRLLSFMGAATSVVVAVVLVHFFYRPLDVLWQVALRRLTG
jgi:succinoglycan biosynthesis transport protein ExoP